MVAGWTSRDTSKKIMENPPQLKSIFILVGLNHFGRKKYVETLLPVFLCLEKQAFAANWIFGRMLSCLVCNEIFVVTRFAWDGLPGDSAAVTFFLSPNIGGHLTFDFGSCELTIPKRPQGIARYMFFFLFLV